MFTLSSVEWFASYVGSHTGCLLDCVNRVGARTAVFKAQSEACSHYLALRGLSVSLGLTLVVSKTAVWHIPMADQKGQTCPQNVRTFVPTNSNFANGFLKWCAKCTTIYDNLLIMPILCSQFVQNADTLRNLGICGNNYAQASVDYMFPQIPRFLKVSAFCTNWEQSMGIISKLS